MASNNELKQNLIEKYIVPAQESRANEAESQRNALINKYMTQEGQEIQSQKNADLRAFDKLMGGVSKKAAEADSFYSSWKSREDSGAFRTGVNIRAVRDSMKQLKEKYGDDRKLMSQLRSTLRSVDSLERMMQHNEDYWNQWGSQEEHDEYQRQSQLWMNQDDRLEQMRDKWAVKPGQSSMTYQQREADIDRVESQIRDIDGQLARSGQGSSYLGQVASPEKVRELHRQRAALEEQLAQLKERGVHTDAEMLDQRIQNARNEAVGIQGTLYQGYAANPAAGNDPAAAEAYSGSMHQLTELEKQKRELDYFRKYDGKKYGGGFFGQFGGSYDIGRMSQDSSTAWNAYLENPTAENRKKAETIDQLMTKFQRDNWETLAADGKLSMVSRDLAQYLPQFFDQMKYQAAGTAIAAPLSIALNALGVPKAEEITKLGAVAGSGVYSYQTMRGAAFKALLEAGMDEETARVAAEDEAVVSSIIEMGDTALDLFTMGGGKLIDLATKGGLGALEGSIKKLAGKNLFTKFAVALGKYGLNVFSEGLEEGTQGAVSIANREREERGITGGWDLTKEAAKIYLDAKANKDSQYRDEINEQEAGGWKIALMMGAGETITNNLSSMALQEYLFDKRYGGSAAELVKEWLEIDPKNKLAQSLQKRLDSGKKVSGTEIAKLVEQNEEVLRKRDSETIQQGIMQRLTDLGETGDVGAIAKALTNQVMGEKQTVAERKVLQGSKFGQRVANELNPENIRSGEYSSRRAQRMETERAHSDVYTGVRDLRSTMEELEITGEDAERLVKNFDQQDKLSQEAFSRGIREAYDFGKLGAPMDRIREDGYATLLDENSRTYAYNLGRLENVKNGQGQEVHLRDGAQWADGANPGGQIPGLEKASRGIVAEKGPAPGEIGAGGKGIGSVQGSISPMDMGIPGGTDEKSLRWVTGKDTSDMRKARAVAEQNGMKIQLFEGGNLRMEAKNGNRFEARAYVQGDKMYVRADHPSIPAYKLARHEAGHYQVEQGKVNVDAVYDKMVKRYGEKYVQRLIDEYAAAYDGSDMNDMEVFEEILCDSVAEINAFGDEYTANQFRKKLKKTVESETVQETESRGPPVEDRGKASLERTTDNKVFVEVDEDILAGVPESKWVSKVKENLKAKFPMGVEVGRNKIVIDGQSRKEMTYSGYMQWLYKNDHDVYADKLRATNNSDEIIKATSDWINEEPNHNRRDKIVDFARGSVLIRVGGVPYSAEVVVGTRRNGKMVLYDVLNLQGASFAKKENDAAKSTNPSPGTARNTASFSQNSIYNSVGKVNQKFSREAVGAAKIEQSTNLQRRQLEYWLGKPKKRNGEFAKPEDVRRVARNIIAEYQSKADKNETVKAMQELADLIIREGDEIVKMGYSRSGLTYDEIRAKAADIAWEIVGNSQALANESDMELYDEIKSYLRKMPLALTEKSDIGDFKEFRKRNFGRLLIKKDGVPIDQVWGEMQDAFGKGFFPDDIANPADMMLHLEELLNGMEEVYYNPYEAAMPQNVEACANAIVDKLFSDAVQPVSTYMDQELESMSQKIQQNEAELRQMKQEKAELLRQNKELSREADGVNQYREARNKTQMKHQIRACAKELDKILNKGTKERNVKEGLRETAGAALNLSKVLFSDMRMETILKGVDPKTITVKERAALDQYLRLAGQRDSLKDRKSKLLKEASESAQAWLDTEDRRNALDAKWENIREQMAPLRDELQSAAQRERARLKSQGMVSMAIDEMAGAYRELAGAEEQHIKAAYDDMVYSRMLELKENLKGAYIDDMTMEQMRDVYDIMQMMMSTVRHSNELFVQGSKKTLTETAQSVRRELAPMQKTNRMATMGMKTASKFHWNNYKPIYAFLRVGSDTLTQLYKNVRKGEDVWYRDMEEAKSFRLETEEKFGFKDWDFEKKYKFASNTGMDFELNLQEIMSLYAYSKREQAWDHVTKGGFVFDPNSEQTVKTKLGTRKIFVDNSTSYNVNMDVWGDIVKTMTEEQRGFVDEMQKYLSETMGGKGNEVSVAMYGVKLFRDPNYFPLRSSDVYDARVKEQQEGTVKIKNKSFTKETTQNANKPIVLTPFMDLWADHVNEMSMYHAFTLALEDFYRVYNFQTAADENAGMNSTVELIQNAHGQAAVGYIDQLLKDINAGRTADPREGVVKQLTGKFKKSAVLGSMSVTVRQASAGPRAWAMVDPKYFVGRKLGETQHKAAWEEMKQYAPIVGIKEMGYFDTGLGMSARDYLLAEEYDGKWEKTKAFFKDQGYRDELMGAAPGWVDEVTWIGIWNAVKREIKDTREDLAVGSEEFMQAVGDRFTDVIQMTQVYDSVFARSGNMRSGSAAMNDITSFMAEPTTTINMAEFAARDLIKSIKNKDGKTAKKSMKTFGAISTTIVLDSLLGAIVYAARDDDDDKNYLEKDVENVVSGLLSGINIFGYIPLARDLWNIAQGFDVERADMSLLGSLMNAINAWGREASKNTEDMTAVQQAEHSRKMWAAAWKVADSLGSLCGEPIRNVRRDILAVRNMFSPSNWVKSSDASVWDAVTDGWRSSLPVSWIQGESKTDKLYAAILGGDTVYENRLKAGYKDDTAVSTAIKKGLRDNDPRIRRAAEAWNSENFETYMELAKAVKKNGFKQDDVVLAIRAEAAALKPKEEEEKEEKAYGMFTTEAYSKAILSGKDGMCETIKEEILANEQENGKGLEDAEKSLQSSVKTKLKEAYLGGDVADQAMEKMLTRYCGMETTEAADLVAKWSFEEEHGFAFGDMKQKYLDGELTDKQAVDYLVRYGAEDRTDAEKKALKWRCEKETGIPAGDIEDAYRTGEISREKAISMMVTYEGKDQESAKLYTEVYDWRNLGSEGAEEMDKTGIDAWYSKGVKTGISKQNFAKWYSIKKSTHETDADGDGKTDKDSVAKQVIAKIGMLPISSKEKEQIALSFWAQKTVNKYKNWK